MPIRPDGSWTNRCSTHKNKMIYGSAATVLDIVLRVQKEQGLLLSWYRCEVHNGYHLCKFKNKEH